MAYKLGLVISTDVKRKQAGRFMTEFLQVYKPTSLLTVPLSLQLPNTQNCITQGPSLILQVGSLSWQCDRMVFIAYNFDIQDCVEIALRRKMPYLYYNANDSVWHHIQQVRLTKTLR